jgi:hypothetical protein
VAPARVVAALGAMQAQDAAGGLWSVGVRAGAACAEVERAVEAGAIVRTWPVRGTLHVVAAEDVRWMLALLGPRVVAGSARRKRDLGLDEATLARGRDVVGEALAGGVRRTRADVMDVLERHGVSTAGQRGYHILWHLAVTGAICFGPPEGKQPTFVLLDEWVPPRALPDRDASLAMLASRYFGSHGPATLADFVGWADLLVGDARRAIELATDLARVTDGDRTWWLPRDVPAAGDIAPSAHLLAGFDEYVLGYKDRGDVLDPAHADRIVPGGNGVFRPTLVVDGRVAGTWRQTVRKRGVTVHFDPFAPLAAAARDALVAAAADYARFLGVPVDVAG